MAKPGYDFQAPWSHSVFFSNIQVYVIDRKLGKPQYKLSTIFFEMSVKAPKLRGQKVGP
jgi:hypothetical protein